MICSMISAVRVIFPFLTEGYQTKKKIEYIEKDAQRVQMKCKDSDGVFNNLLKSLPSNDRLHYV